MLKVGRSVVEGETVIAVSPLGLGTGEIQENFFFHKENQTFTSHTPESQSLEYLLPQQKHQATKMMLCIPPLSRRTAIQGVYLNATSSLQSLMVLVCYHCFSQQSIVPIFLPQVHYAHSCLLIQRKITHPRKYIMQISMQIKILYHSYISNMSNL